MSTYILRKGVSRLSDLADGAGALGALVAAGGNWYYCDPTHGTAGGDGKTPTTANSNLKTVYDRCRDGYNDGVFLIGGATAYNPAAAFDWQKSYCHLVGLTADLPGLGQRARIVMLAATVLTPAMTFSGSGNLIKNIQFSNEKAAGAAAGCVIVTGLRNQFENCFFMSPTSDYAASYSLKMSGSENVFNRCTIGQLTNFRANATYGLWLLGAAAVSRNKFIQCEFLAWSGGTPSAHVHVLIDAEIATLPWVTWFEDCLFHNNLAGGTIQVQAIDDNCSAAGHQVVLRGHNDFLGCGVVGDNLTYMFAPNPAADVSGLLMVTVAES